MPFQLNLDIYEPVDPPGETNTIALHLYVYNNSILLTR